MRAVETIKNIWKIEDLRNRILTTLLLVAIYRFGTYVVLPGIDPKAKNQSVDSLLDDSDLVIPRSYLLGEFKRSA